MAAYSLGLDFGTMSARALLLDLDSGAEVAVAQAPYRHGVITDASEPNLARQWPGDYIEALQVCVREVLARAPGLHAEQIAGIGVDTTGSTPLPVDARGRPLAAAGDDREHALEHDRAAMAWLWKDHTAIAQAQEITEHARRSRPEYLARCGGTYSSEWFWSKALCCLRTAPRVFQAAFAFVELCDFMPAFLTGAGDPRRWKASICAAGHKAMFATQWGGWPDREFLAGLAPELAALREHLPQAVLTADMPAGTLAADVAQQLGLAAGTPVAVGALDAHLGAVGAGISQGELVKVIGTSTCDMAVAYGTAPPRIDGLCGVVPGSILPRAIGFEAGQSAVGDIFEWCAKYIAQRDHASLNRDAARLWPGESGLLALDWHNGNRCVLVDPRLSGMIVGLNLQTKDHEIYRAMMEATAFGARVIVERLTSCGVPVQSILACGGIATKSPLLMQIYADVLRRPVQVVRSSETCARGAAIMGAVAAGRFEEVEQAQAKLCARERTVHAPDAARAEIYDRLYACYLQLHDAFAGRGRPVGRVMKDLLALREQVRRGL